MSTRIVMLAAAAALFATGSSFAAPSAMIAPPVPQSVINAGPQLPSGETDDSLGWAHAEIDYLHQVCPTVLGHPGQYRSDLVTFCQEMPG